MAAKRSAKKISKARRSPKPDFNQVAQRLVRLSTGQEGPAEPEVPTRSEISRVMAELGRRGGKIGGRNRAASLSPEQRREIALKAARSRWDREQSQR